MQVVLVRRGASSVEVCVGQVYDYGGALTSKYRSGKMGASM